MMTAGSTVTTPNYKGAGGPEGMARANEEEGLVAAAMAGPPCSFVMEVLIPMLQRTECHELFLDRPLRHPLG